jgi:hypothetical protein
MSVDRSFVAWSGAMALGLTVLLSPPTAAHAEGFLEALFGGLSRALSGGSTRGYAPEPDPAARLLGQQRSPAARTSTASGATASGTVGSSRGFCVRTCDGAHFPVQSRRGFSAAEACSAFCPAADTKVFYGSNIDTATSRDGSRYAALNTAHLYQQRLVPGCTCDGKPTGGLARIDAASDPTLRHGDIVVTATGPVVYSGTGKAADFKPVDAARLPPRERDKLAQSAFAPRDAQDDGGLMVQDRSRDATGLSFDEIGLRR